MCARARVEKPVGKEISDSRIYFQCPQGPASAAVAATAARQVLKGFKRVYKYIHCKPHTRINFEFKRTDRLNNNDNNYTVVIIIIVITHEFGFRKTI